MSLFLFKNLYNKCTICWRSSQNSLPVSLVVPSAMMRQNIITGSMHQVIKQCEFRQQNRKFLAVSDQCRTCRILMLLLCKDLQLSLLENLRSQRSQLPEAISQLAYKQTLCLETTQVSISAMSIAHNLATSLSSFSLPVWSMWKLILMSVTVKPVKPQYTNAYLASLPNVDHQQKSCCKPKELMYFVYSCGCGCTFFSLSFSSKLNPDGGRLTSVKTENRNTQFWFWLRLCIKRCVNPNEKYVCGVKQLWRSSQMLTGTTPNHHIAFVHERKITTPKWSELAIFYIFNGEDDN